MQDVARRVADPALDVPSLHPDTGLRERLDPLPARLSSGWFPWAWPELHGGQSARVVLNCEGMGGNASWADPVSGLGVCVLKSVYEPLSVLGGSVSPDVVRIAAEIRTALGLAQKGDADWVASNDEIMSRGR